MCLAAAAINTGDICGLLWGETPGLSGKRGYRGKYRDTYRGNTETNAGEIQR